MALIAVGFSKLFESRGAGGLVWAGLVMAAGVVLLLDNLGIWHVSLGHDLACWRWWESASACCCTALERKNLPGSPRPGQASALQAPTRSGNGRTFSGIKRRLHTQDFQGGEMIAVFGGIEVDLREANMPARQRSGGRRQRHIWGHRVACALQLASGDARHGHFWRLRGQDRTAPADGGSDSSAAIDHRIRGIRRRQRRKLSRSRGADLRCIRFSPAGPDSSCTSRHGSLWERCWASCSACRLP